MCPSVLNYSEKDSTSFPYCYYLQFLQVCGSSYVLICTVNKPILELAGLLVVFKLCKLFRSLASNSQVTLLTPDVFHEQTFPLRFRSKGTNFFHDFARYNDKFALFDDIVEKIVPEIHSLLNLRSSSENS